MSAKTSVGEPDPSLGKDFKKVSKEDRWVEIQRKTFTNWINEQLSVSGKAITDIEKDFCDGVNLVALVEALQFKKIGKVITNPTGRIQMIQNVSLACKAIMEDNIRLVNIGKLPWIMEAHEREHQLFNPCC